MRLPSALQRDSATNKGTATSAAPTSAHFASFEVRLVSFSCQGHHASCPMRFDWATSAMTKTAAPMAQSQNAGGNANETASASKAVTAAQDAHDLNVVPASDRNAPQAHTFQARLRRA
jgi:hypothetical protein